MSEIQIISKESHKTLSTTMESTTTIPTEPSVVLLKIPMNDISVIKKDGLNAIVFLKNGEKIVIQNFFNEENTLDNSLVIQEALLHKDLKCKAPLIEPNLRRNLGKWST
ncbi:BapA prefix-like domain-containing protein [Acinetobacter junii]|uniref:BapA/Bap/LapF family prefix-like domain-containing protein n=1 Tax=Acinetobacter junii TaxID=40215 RepID=UPI001BA68C55|nr:BapA prefix-like domain-containing protein [Acinetobacter junii]QUS50823.1 BapA prefix-like domain-containing protein [Acinetobacter junii]QXR10052.1 BapA prefix-like domain-containing protein [Acinetobacter junii]